jgi:hypothetical protein
MTTDPQAPLLSPQPDVTGGALRASLGQNASGYLVYWDAHGRQQMAGYSRLRAYGANQTGNWRLVTLASYDAILAPVTQSFNQLDHKLHTFRRQLRKWPHADGCFSPLSEGRTIRRNTR